MKIGTRYAILDVDLIPSITNQSKWKNPDIVFGRHAKEVPIGGVANYELFRKNHHVLKTNLEVVGIFKFGEITRTSKNELW